MGFAFAQPILRTRPIRRQARPRFGDAHRHAPSHPEYREIARDEGHEPGVGGRIALDHQSKTDRKRLTDQQANDERQQQGHGSPLCLAYAGTRLGDALQWDQFLRDDRSRLNTADMLPQAALSQRGGWRRQYTRKFDAPAIECMMASAAGATARVYLSRAIKLVVPICTKSQ